MSKILSGETQQTRLLPTIARALGVSVAYLIGESAEPVAGMAVGVLPADESVFLTQVRVLSTTDRRSVFRILDSLAQTSGSIDT